jgi:hypothetical protein
MHEHLLQLVDVIYIYIYSKQVFPVLGNGKHSCGNKYADKKQKNFRFYATATYKHTSITIEELLGYVFSMCFLCGPC